MARARNEGRGPAGSIARWIGATLALVVLSPAAATASDYSDQCQTADGSFVIEDKELFEASVHRAGSASALAYTVLSETVEAEETGYCVSWAKAAAGQTFGFEYRRFVQRIAFESGGTQRTLDMRCELDSDGLPASLECDRKVITRRSGVVAKTPVAASLWRHNGSTLALAVDGEQRRFLYTEPRAGLAANGVRPGTMLFDGQTDGRRYQGRARIFTKSCGELSYAVSGPVEQGGARVVLAGKAPRLDEACSLTGWADDRLVFDLKE
jgi:hypothetical protein